MEDRVSAVDDCGRGKLETLETLEVLLQFSSMSVCKQRTGILLFIDVPLLAYNALDFESLPSEPHGRTVLLIQELIVGNWNLVDSTEQL